MVGPAILYLPNGFASAGYAVALPILATSACMYLYSSKCLLESWKLESDKALVAGEGVSLLESGRQEGNRKRRSSVVLSYPELAYRSLGTQGEALVKVGIALMQSGVCLTYMIFVPQNIASCVLILFGWDVPPSYFMVVMLVFQIPFCWIRDIRKLTLTNFFANLLILYGLITCLGFAISNAARSDHGDGGRGPLAEIRYKFANLEAFKSGWLLFIGTSVSAERDHSWFVTTCGFGKELFMSLPQFLVHFLVPGMIPLWMVNPGAIV